MNHFKFSVRNSLLAAAIQLPGSTRDLAAARPTNATDPRHETLPARRRCSMRRCLEWRRVAKCARVFQALKMVIYVIMRSITPIFTYPKAEIPLNMVMSRSNI